MIRNTVLWLSVFAVLTYTWKDWYRGLCGLIALMAIMEHPDVPKQMLGVPGLNPFNLLIANILAAWAVQRKQEGLTFDLPRHIGLVLLCFAAVVLLGFFRLTRSDIGFVMFYYDASFANLVSDYLLNPFKFAIPAILLYDGCRTEERFRLALIAILSVYIVLGLQVAKWMPPTLALDADALERRGLRVLASGIGYHRVNLSAMLSGASWAILSMRPLLPRGIRIMALLTALFVVYAQVMTGGRAGYAAWVAVGLVMSLLKWRRYLLLVPAALMAVFLVAPGILGRATEGFTAESRDSSQRIDQLRHSGDLSNSDGTVDSYTVTAGRSIAWPVVIEYIKRQPWIGYGRQAMLSSGAALYIYETYREGFPHPHNAYLEALLDNGIIGALPIFLLYGLMFCYAVRMFLSRESPTCIAIGGMATAMIFSLFVSALGSQSFYPEEGWVGMWCAMFLMLRVRVERKRLTASAAPAAIVSSAPTLPMLRPAFAGQRQPVAAPASANVTMSPIPAVKWQPRKASAGNPPGNSPTEKSNAPVPRPAGSPGPIPKATPGPRFRPSLPFMPKQGIASLGIFGSTVTDPLVWERA